MFLINPRGATRCPSRQVMAPFIQHRGIRVGPPKWANKSLVGCCHPLSKMVVCSLPDTLSRKPCRYRLNPPPRPAPASPSTFSHQSTLHGAMHRNTDSFTCQPGNGFFATIFFFAILCRHTLRCSSRFSPSGLLAICLRLTHIEDRPSESKSPQKPTASILLPFVRIGLINTFCDSLYGWLSSAM